MKIFILTLLLSLPVFSAPLRFDFRDALQRNSVDAVMQGALERTVAVSHAISGWMEVDSESVGKGLRGELEVDLRTFETGMAFKNLFLKEKLFDTAQYPTSRATFVKIISISQGRLQDSQEIDLKVETQVQIKSVSRNTILPLKLIYYKENENTKVRLPGNLLYVHSTFDLDLAQFGLTLPDIVKSAANKSATVNVSLVGSDKLPVGTDSLIDGMKPKEPLPSTASKKP